jgi:hypothetical protein
MTIVDQQSSSCITVALKKPQADTVRLIPHGGGTHHVPAASPFGGTKHLFQGIIRTYIELRCLDKNTCLIDISRNEMAQ